MRRRGALGVAMVLAAVGPARAAAETAAPTSLQGIFDEAVAAAARGDHDAALAGFDRLVEVGVADPDVFVDRATVHAWSGRYGMAIRDYRAALAQRPGDEVARRGVQAAREALARQRAERDGEAEVGASASPFGDLTAFLDEPRAAVAVVVLEALFFVALAVFLRSRRESVKVAASLTAAALGAGLVLAIVVLGIRRGAFVVGEPAVIVADATLVDGPVAGATPRGEVVEGADATVLDRREGHLRVRVGGEEGWLPRASVGVVGE